MKRILITGANSYVGTSFEKHLKQWEGHYQVDTVDMVDGSWRERSFRGYDAVFHVAGIVHLKNKRNDPQQIALFEAVNVRLAVETAQKAKAEGVKQFIFMSSTSVYGLVAPVFSDNQPVLRVRAMHIVIIGNKTEFLPRSIQDRNKLLRLCVRDPVISFTMKDQHRTLKFFCPKYSRAFFVFLRYLLGRTADHAEIILPQIFALLH